MKHSVFIVKKEKLNQQSAVTCPKLEITSKSVVDCLQNSTHTSYMPLHFWGPGRKGQKANDYARLVKGNLAFL